MANNAPKLFKRTALFALTTLCMHSATAGVVRDDVDYQLFRDFAENKGKFAVGASNIEIKDKDGKSLGVILNGVPMPDFSFADRNTAITSLIHPQYVASVAHNSDRFWGGFDNIYENLLKQKHSNAPTFGGQNINPDAHHYSYHIVDRNDPLKYYDNQEVDERGVRSNDMRYDYNMPRLFKMVTEVIPIDIANTDKESQSYKDKELFPTLVKLGSGIQFVWQKGVQASYYNPSLACRQIPCLARGYKYLTGGVDFDFGETPRKAHIKNLITLDVPIQTSPFSIYSQSGDSGSPILIFDKIKNQWFLFATLRDQDPNEFSNGATLTDKSYFNTIRKEDVGAIIDNTNNNIYRWFNEIDNNEIKKSNIISSDNLVKIELDIKIDNNDTKNWQDENGLIANKQKEINKNYIPKEQRELLSDIRNYFNNGKDLYIQGKYGVLELQQSINQGAGGLYFYTDFDVIGKSSDVTWLGSGIFIDKNKTVTWQIKNPENDRLSKIGEGTLLVNGTGDNKGDISVGDGLVVLNQKDGKAFNKVGIVSGRPVVKLENDKQVNPNDIYFGYRGGRLDLNGNHLSFDYIQNVDSGAMIVNHNPNQSATITLKTDATDKHKSAFNGVFGETNKDFFGNPLQDKNYHNGALNVIYNPDSPQSDKTFLLSGGTNLNGDLTVEKGNLLLSGRPTPHAYDHLKSIEPFQDNDWIDRTFTAKNFIVNNDGKLTVGRNVSELNGNVTLKDKATGEIGYMNNQTSICVRSDYFGTTDCQAKNYDDTVLKTIPITKVTGDMTLNNESQLTFGKAHLLGKVIADDKTVLTLSKDSQWTMTGDSTTGDLNLQDGSTIHLNANYDKATTALYNVLTVGGKLTGNGKFNYLTNLAEQQGDKVIVKGIASGTHTLNVKDTGKEPFSPKDLVLLDLQNTNQTNENLTVKLTNAQNGKETVDLGAWRYELAQVGNQFVLMDKRHKNTPSKYTNQALSAKYAQLNNAFSATNGITAHLWNAPKYKGIWATVERDDRTLESPVFRNYDSEHTLTQLGVDETVDVRQGQLLVGTALSYGKGVQTFDDGKGESELMLGSAYGKWTSPKNAFVSFDLGLGQGTQHLTLTDKVKAKHTFAHLGLGVGKTWQTGNFTATPSLAVRQYHFGGDRYAMDGANIAYGKANILSYQPSIRLGYQFNTQSGLTLRPYLASTYTHTDDKAKVQVNTHQFTVPFADTWQHKVGLEAQKGKLYGQLYASQEQGDHIKDGQKIGLSVGYGW